jgi:hypothetical protein
MTDFTLRPPSLRGPRLAAPTAPRRVAVVRDTRLAAAVRRRTLVRRATVAVVAVALLTVGITDVRGHVEIGQIDQAQGVASNKLSALGLNVTLTRANSVDQENRVWNVDVQMTENRLMIGSTNVITDQQEVGIFFDKIDLSALDGCLSGVTQALDQVGVGQTDGALASLGAAGPACQAANP